MCYVSLPAIQDCVEKWHQNHQQTLQPCTKLSRCHAYKPLSAKSRSCQSCIQFGRGKAVESELYPREKPIQWKNVNAKLLHKDPVEVAKGFVFIIPDGQDCYDFSDFDIGGILKLMMGLPTTMAVTTSVLTRCGRYYLNKVLICMTALTCLLRKANQGLRGIYHLRCKIPIRCKMSWPTCSKSLQRSLISVQTIKLIMSVTF